MNYAFTTQPQIRKAFWQGLDNHQPVSGWSQNDYKTIIRCEFVEFVDRLRRDELISECLAKRVTL
jgi:hypothetical protein